uniref:Uncharacterized protein n=1 Tax=Roseihalotalea indica TaxID=2867963 RepID=A0AA49GIM1_9BACT|nr:hypothetical protein K4G66_18430 [Tunicatimonas sp. TK19036]
MTQDTRALVDEIKEHYFLVKKNSVWGTLIAAITVLVGWGFLSWSNLGDTIEKKLDEKLGGDYEEYKTTMETRLDSLETIVVHGNDYLNGLKQTQVEAANISGSMEGMNTNAQRILNNLRKNTPYIPSAGSVVKPKYNVFNFLQGEPPAPYNQDERQRLYVHIKTPDTAKNGQFWRYDLKGYAYGSVMPLDITWIGYAYADATDDLIANDQVVLNNSLLKESPVKASQYIGSDNHHYLKFGPIDTYYLSFYLDFIPTHPEVIDHNFSGFEVKFRSDDGPM